MYYKIRKYLQFYFKADTIYNIHSPFIYDFILDVLSTDKNYYAFNSIEFERRILSSNINLVELTDYGAGSKTGQKKIKTIKEIANNVVSNPRKCRILFNLVNKFQPRTTIELGTSLGISTLYLAKASSKNYIYTIEADPAIHKLASTLFLKNNLSNVKAIKGTFEETLKEVIGQCERIDLAYIDGNHQYQSTLDYFYQLKEKSHSKSIFVFDDIYWSEGMTKAWEKIKADRDVVYTIDIFDLGFVFFDKQIGEKKDFVLIDWKKKPYRIGLIN